MREGRGRPRSLLISLLLTLLLFPSLSWNTAFVDESAALATEGGAVAEESAALAAEDGAVGGAAEESLLLPKRRINLNLNTNAPKATATTVRGGVTAASQADRQVGRFRLTKTVANHANDIVKSGPFKGQLSRPYLNSPHTIEQIMKGGKGVPDPGGVPGALRRDVSGTFRGSKGTWELVVNKSNEILHFNFVR